MNIIKIFLILVGLVLILDQLWLFGVPFGPFLPDLSWLDPTHSDLFHHWMLGFALVLCGLFLPIGRRK